MQRWRSTDLPEVMVEEILRRLPVKPLVRFKCVCKRWGARYRNPNFIEAHHRTQIAINDAKFMPSKFLLRRTKVDGSVFFTSLELRIDEEENVTLTEKENNFFPFLSKPSPSSPSYHYFCQDFAGVSGPCNGIVCLARDDGIALWNPATREIKFLPSSTLKPAADSYLRLSFVNGFGYDSKSDDYKVLRTIFDEQWKDPIRFEVREGVSRVELYSLKKNEWKLLPDYKYAHLQPVSNFCMDGVYHMLSDYCTYNGRSGVVSFDLGDEVLTTTGFPRWDSAVDTLKTLTPIGNCIGMVRHILQDGFFEIWILKEIGVEDSWIKERTVGPVECVSRFFGFWKDKILVEINKEPRLQKEQIAVYDPENGRLQTLRFTTIHDHEMEFFNFISEIVAHGGEEYQPLFENNRYSCQLPVNYVECLAPINERYEHHEGIIRVSF